MKLLFAAAASTAATETNLISMCALLPGLFDFWLLFFFSAQDGGCPQRDRLLGLQPQTLLRGEGLFAGETGADDDF